MTSLATNVLPDTPMAIWGPSVAMMCAYRLSEASSTESPRVPRQAGHSMLTKVLSGWS